MHGVQLVNATSELSWQSEMLRHEYSKFLVTVEGRPSFAARLAKLVRLFGSC